MTAREFRSPVARLLSAVTQRLYRGGEETDGPSPGQRLARRLLHLSHDGLARLKRHSPRALLRSRRAVRLFLLHRLAPNSFSCDVAGSQTARFDPRAHRTTTVYEVASRTQAANIPGVFYEKKQTANRFSGLTLERHRAFVRNWLLKMEKTGKSNAALTTGVYHAPNLSDLLKVSSFGSNSRATVWRTEQTRGFHSGFGWLAIALTWLALSFIKSEWQSADFRGAMGQEMSQSAEGGSEISQIPKPQIMKQLESLSDLEPGQFGIVRRGVGYHFVYCARNRDGSLGYAYYAATREIEIRGENEIPATMNELIEIL